tara:strand:+ start:8267 stop:9271 length:1005 start_codon:yes stop_codon:yes gene_type:complete
MQKNNFKNKNILIAGGTGMVGQALVPKLKKYGARIYIASMDSKHLSPKGIKKFYKLDLININNCLRVTKKMDCVINLLGVTGSPKINYSNPGSFMMSNLYCAVNLLYAAQKNRVSRYLYTSTYGVYGEESSMKENDMWNHFPSINDKYAGWAKRMGELQIEAYKKEFKFKGLHVIRPANIYGPYANFNPKNSMVVASIIRRVVEGENPLKVWGDGKAIRDFIYSEDVADAIIKVINNNIQVPINVGSGKGTTIKKLVSEIVNCSKIKFKPKVIFEKSKKSGGKVGDRKRVLNVKLARKYNIKNKINLSKGLMYTIDWYLKNKKRLNSRFDYFAK